MCAMPRAGYLLAILQGGCGFSDRGKHTTASLCASLFEDLDKRGQDARTRLWAIHGWKSVLHVVF